MTRKVPLGNGTTAEVHTGGAACCPDCGEDERRWQPYFDALARGDMDEARRLETDILAAVSEAKAKGKSA